MDDCWCGRALGGGKYLPLRRCSVGGGAGDAEEPAPRPGHRSRRAGQLSLRRYRCVFSTPAARSADAVAPGERHQPLPAVGVFARRRLCRRSFVTDRSLRPSPFFCCCRAVRRCRVGRLAAAAAAPRPTVAVTHTLTHKQIIIGASGRRHRNREKARNRPRCCRRPTCWRCSRPAARFALRMPASAGTGPTWTSRCSC